MSDPKPVYFNPVQIQFASAPQRIKCLVAGRGFGKSSLIALIVYFWLDKMPRAKIFFSSTTFEQLDNSTLPPIREKWLELGLIEGVHFVVGKRPPENWAQPYKPPKKFERVITFWNGFTIQLLSVERMNSRRGGSFDAGIVDEAAFVKFAAFKSVLSASIRGNIGRFPLECHRSLVILSSRPRTPQGKWIYLFRELMEKNKKKALYMEASAEDNVDILGPDWFEEQRETMGELDYIIEILNKEVDVMEGAFYHKWNDRNHTYKPSIDAMGNMLDVNKEALLEASFDYGGWFSGITVWQEYINTNTETLIRKFFVKNDLMDNLVDQFCDHFEHHHFKYVRIWGEPRIHDRTAMGKIVDTIVKRLQSRGWMTEVMVQAGYKTERHTDRFDTINAILDEANPLLPKIKVNASDCEAVITAIKLAQVNEDGSKNKAREKDREFPQENATHFTDTIDYYLLQKHGWKIHQGSNQRAGEAYFG